jgi:toxin CptA
MTSAPAIGFEYRPSRWLNRLLLAVSMLAALAVALCALPWGIKLAMGVVLLVSLRQALMRQAARSVEAVGLAHDTGWSLRMSAGEDVTATLGSFRVWGENFIWLRLCLPGQGHVPLLLAPDNSDADIRRRLRMRLAQIEAAGHSGG